MAQSAAKKTMATSQSLLPIAEIREDTVVLRDGTLRAVLAVSSINFGLKSEEEQEAIIAAYRQFINILDFPLQVVIQSRKLNISDYLERLLAAEQTQTNELLRQQIRDYRSFVAQLVELGEIMSKKFFMVIPYNPLSDKRKSFWSRLGDVFQPGRFIRMKDERFRVHKNELDLRIGHVESALSSAGLKTVRLDTQGLIELYYTVYNPETSEAQPLVELDKLQVTNA